MARRRGVPLDDPESVERRRWHLQLQKEVFQSDSAKISYCSSNKNSSVEDKAPPCEAVVLLPAGPKAKNTATVVNTTRHRSRITTLSNPKSPVCRLLCLHGFGGSAQLFNSWGDYFESMGIEVWGYDFPGRGGRIAESPLRSISELASDATAHVTSALYSCGATSEMSDRTATAEAKIGAPFSDVPLMIWGHSVGAFVALRLCQSLHASNIVSATHLMVSQCRAPQVQSEFNASEHTVKLFRSTERDIRLRMLSLGAVPDYLFDRMDMLRTHYSIFRADYEAFETFEFNDPIPDEVQEVLSPAPTKAVRANYGWEEDEEDQQWKEAEVIIPYPLHCPVSVFGAMDDELVRPDHMKEWLNLSRGKNKSHIYDTGGYFFFKRKENESLLIKKIVNICLGIKEEEEEQIETVDEKGGSADSPEERESTVSEEL